MQLTQQANKQTNKQRQLANDNRGSQQTMTKPAHKQTNKKVNKGRKQTNKQRQ